MNVKLFFETHGRFPSQHEFRLLKESSETRTKSKHLSETTAIDQFVEFARQGKLDEMKKIASLVKDINDSPPSYGGGERSRGTALCLAAQGDHIDVVKWLLDNGAKVDVRTSSGRTALLFAAESGHFNMMNYLISRGATFFTYSDQQIESYYISFTIRQSITRRELSYVLPGEFLPGLVLDYLGLGGNRIRPIERLATNNKTGFGIKPTPTHIISPTPDPSPLPAPLETPPIVQRKRTVDATIITSSTSSLDQGNVSSAVPGVMMGSALTMQQLQQQQVQQHQVQHQPVQQGVVMNNMNVGMPNMNVPMNMNMNAPNLNNMNGHVAHGHGMMMSNDQIMMNNNVMGGDMMNGQMMGNGVMVNQSNQHYIPNYNPNQQMRFPQGYQQNMMPVMGMVLNPQYGMVVTPNGPMYMPNQIPNQMSSQHPVMNAPVNMNNVGMNGQVPMNNMNNGMVGMNNMGMHHVPVQNVNMNNQNMQNMQMMSMNPMPPQPQQQTPSPQ